ncbi:ATP-binding protein [Streptomyces sp. NPDC046316]|uniref:ATP-binding protein n=1 Tax=Streptomyces sp. NPDC046316 TaxID=3154494 RepID=UPI0033D90D6E
MAHTHAYPADLAATWRLGHTPTSVATARRQAREQTARWAVPQETAFHTELSFSELVTNAIRYGSPPLKLRLINDHTLTRRPSSGRGSGPGHPSGWCSRPAQWDGVSGEPAGHLAPMPRAHLATLRGLRPAPHPGHRR